MHTYAPATAARQPSDAINLAAVFANPDTLARQQEEVELSLDADVLEALHSAGDDWQTVFNAILRQWLQTSATAR